MSDTQTIVRKVQLVPVGDKTEVDRVYQFLRDGMYNQNKAYNILISNVYSAIYAGKSAEEINEIYKKGKRNPKENDETWSLYKYGAITFAKGLSTAGTIGMRVKKDIATAKANGLFKGKCSLPNKRLDSPLLIEHSQFSFYHNYETYDKFLNVLYDDALEVFMKFVNGITFKVIFGNPHKSAELRSVFQNIFEELYKIQQSSIQFDKRTGKKIILNLSLQIPKKEVILDENTVVGVDLGINIPAVCSLNNNTYIHKSLGDDKNLKDARIKLQAQRKRLQKNLKFTSGGHGRNKKLQALDKLSERERNFVRTYNHKISYEVIKFALENRAKYINIEDLEGYDASEFILRNWSYFQLQQYIIYKAEKYGIVVRKINPAYTSQKCSCCGYVDRENRPKEEKGQAYFKCISCGNEMNADYNASINIARSTDFK